MDEIRLLPRLVAALILGSALGFEREWRRKPAGLRTHVLVSLSTAALMAGADLLQTEDGATIGDPVRMAQGILTGIGFIGAGTIVHQRNMVTGITTAATIWLAAAVGTLSGSGLYILAVSLAVLSLISLDGMEWLVVRLGHEHDTDPESERDKDD